MTPGTPAPAGGCPGVPGCSTPRGYSCLGPRFRGGVVRPPAPFVRRVSQRVGSWLRVGRAWRRPTLPRLSGAVPLALGVFTAEFGMGSGALPPAMATRPGEPAAGDRERVTGVWRPGLAAGCGRPPALRPGGGMRVRAISTGRLHRLLGFHPRPIDVVVFHGSRRDLVLRGASRLDAFSGYPVRT